MFPPSLSGRASREGSTLLNSRVPVADAGGSLSVWLPDILYSRPWSYGGRSMATSLLEWPGKITEAVLATLSLADLRPANVAAEFVWSGRSSVPSARLVYGRNEASTWQLRHAHAGDPVIPHLSTVSSAVNLFVRPLETVGLNAMWIVLALIVRVRAFRLPTRCPGARAVTGGRRQAW
jgi:hypothetical protein